MLPLELMNIVGTMLWLRIIPQNLRLNLDPEWIDDMFFLINGDVDNQYNQYQCKVVDEKSVHEPLWPVFWGQDQFPQLFLVGKTSYQGELNHTQMTCCTVQTRGLPNMGCTIFETHKLVVFICQYPKYTDHHRSTSSTENESGDILGPFFLNKLREWPSTGRWIQWNVGTSHHSMVESSSIVRQYLQWDIGAWTSENIPHLKKWPGQLQDRGHSTTYNSIQIYSNHGTGTS